MYMLQITPCATIIGSRQSPETLLVVETGREFLQAGFVCYKAGIEVVTTPGTYFQHDFSMFEEVSLWDPERAATALTAFWFDRESKNFNTMKKLWLGALMQAVENNEPYLLI